MIRINLLATERSAAKAAAPGFQAGQKMMVIGSLLLVLTVVGVGWRYWALGQEEAQIARVRSKRSSAKKRGCRKSSSRSRNSRTAASCSKRASR